MSASRPFAALVDRLKAAGLRPTRQRLQLLRVLAEGGHRHLTAEQLASEAKAAGFGVALATVYNTLNQFTQAGLLREVVVEPGRSYFDTNLGDHHHFFDESANRLIDIPADQIAVAALPAPPAGKRVARVDVIVRVTDSDTSL
ncbi:MAG: transcriptional repressor [Azospirillum sp.]|nr:transcriptional repressor [Azospirillum sp.]MCZ8122319.1 Fur family transcriptional regulator [Magnetospirillum sp.]